MSRMPVIRAALLLAVSLFPGLVQSAQFDVTLVLDNSGSMKKNDPNFLAKDAVAGFIQGLEGDVRTSIIIFDQKVRVAVPLSELNLETEGELLASLDKVDYRGLFTNSPDAMERAIYGLKMHGRADVPRFIVFMTDGIVDTGDKERDRESAKWMRESLAESAAREGIRIFGIAFTDNADFVLIQSLAQKTNGEYFRAYKPEDLDGVFQRIAEIIARPIEPVATAAETAASDEQTRLQQEALLLEQQKLRDEMLRQKQELLEQQQKILAQQAEQARRAAELAKQPAAQGQQAASGDSMMIIIGGAFGLLLLVVIVVLLARKGRAGSSNGAADASMPKAFLNDLSGNTDSASHALTGKVTMIGRVAGTESQIDYIVVDQQTVGRRHALIEYRDFAFWLKDQDSVNGTFVNDKPVAGSPVQLKHGDRVRVHRCEFEFVMPDMFDSGMTVMSHTTFSNPDEDDDKTHIAGPDDGPAGTAAAPAAPAPSAAAPPAAPAPREIEIELPPVAEPVADITDAPVITDDADIDLDVTAINPAGAEPGDEDATAINMDVVDAPADCPNHADVAGTLECEVCHRMFCETCIPDRSVESICPACHNTMDGFFETNLFKPES